MNRFTKTTLVALAIVAGTTFGSIAQTKSVRLDPISKDLYRLTYLNEGSSNIKVEVLDRRGKILFSEFINENNSFSKTYDFQDLKFGEYSFKVSDHEGKYVTKINRVDNVVMTAKIKKVDDEKAEVMVKGEFIKPVSVNIFDRDGVIMFEDRLEFEKGFTKTYDLSKLRAHNISIEVVSEDRLLATTSF